MIKEVIKLIRPWQWVKNLFVFLPMFFAGQMGNVGCGVASMMAFFVICLVASSIYCINDIVDVEENRCHPRKCNRPVAKGTVSVVQAAVISVSLVIVGFGILFLSMPLRLALNIGAVVLAYYLMNIAYCFWLKRLAIIDVFCIGIGFVLRIFMGGIACHIWISPWIVCLTFLLTLFLAFAKRRDDLILRNKKGVSVRESATQYNLTFMNQTLGLLGTMTVVCYILYTVQPEVVERLGTPWVYLTSVFVLAGVLRYLQIAIVDEQSGDPTAILLKDRFIQGCVIFWGISYLVIIYL